MHSIWVAIAPSADKVMVKSSQDVFRMMRSLVYALFASAMTTSINKIVPTTINIGPSFSGLAKLGMTPGGAFRAGCRRKAGS